MESRPFFQQDGDQGFLGRRETLEQGLPGLGEAGRRRGAGASRRGRDGAGEVSTMQTSSGCDRPRVPTGEPESDIQVVELRDFIPERVVSGRSSAYCFAISHQLPRHFSQAPRFSPGSNAKQPAGESREGSPTPACSLRWSSSRSTSRPRSGAGTFRVQDGPEGGSARAEIRMARTSPPSQNPQAVGVADTTNPGTRRAGGRGPARASRASRTIPPRSAGGSLRPARIGSRATG